MQSLQKILIPKASRYLFTRYVYNCLILVYSFVALFWLFFKRAYKKSSLLNWWERLGFVKSHNDNPIWIHGVSVGESQIGFLFWEKFIRLGHNCIVSTTTVTGKSHIEKLSHSKCYTFFFPFDFSFFVKRALQKINPKMIVIVETEIWPNLLYYANKNNIPVVIANARLSKKSFQNYYKIKTFFAQSMCGVNVWVRNRKDLLYFKKLGVKKCKSYWEYEVCNFR